MKLLQNRYWKKYIMKFWISHSNVLPACVVRTDLAAEPGTGSEGSRQKERWCFQEWLIGWSIDLLQGVREKTLDTIYKEEEMHKDESWWMWKFLQNG